MNIQSFYKYFIIVFGQNARLTRASRYSILFSDIFPACDALHHILGCYSVKIHTVSKKRCILCWHLNKHNNYQNQSINGQNSVIIYSCGLPKGIAREGGGAVGGRRAMSSPNTLGGNK